MQPSVERNLIKIGRLTRLWASVDELAPLVEVRGLEPLTPWLQTMCSAN